jgi:Dolichyl-phosphate-mannose-protein mannosyltransferase
MDQVPSKGRFRRTQATHVPSGSAAGVGDSAISGADQGVERRTTGAVADPPSAAWPPPEAARRAEHPGELPGQPLVEPPAAALQSGWARVPVWAWLAAILALAAFVRLWQINALGYNSDEAVYSGQGAAIADDPLSEFFPAFRAHPLLMQTIFSIGYRIGAGEIFARLVVAALGVLTVYVVYRLGDLIYNRKVGLVAALLMAVMPYHVIVTRQVLLDGPLTLFATVTLYMLARFALTQRPIWLYATGAAMGMTFLAKESGIVLIGSIYAFLALTPEVRFQPKVLARAAGVMLAFMAAFPISLAIAGATSTGGNFLAWQLFRRPNHDLWFYPSEVTLALGPLLVVAAVFGLWRVRHHFNWREILLVSWIAVPVVFFEIWAVKGFQYLLPVAPAIAVLAARGLVSTPKRPTVPGWQMQRVGAGPRLTVIVTAVVAISLLIPTLQRINPSDSEEFLAGSGGVPGGREAGNWIADNVPEGARIMTIGPSMANILQYYGRRQANGLSVSPNPLNRNPVYEPLENPDELIRDNELQYVVWDAFSASRSEIFSDKLRRYADRYNGRVVHDETVPATTASGKQTTKPIIRIWEVRP